jgi:hypothetical protein
MTNAFQAKQQQPDDLLDSSLERQQVPQTQPKTNNDLVSELMQNLSGLANLDFSNFGCNNNLQHLLKATNHLKQAQSEFEMAK